MKIDILHLGYGRVGSELLKQLASLSGVISSRLGVDLNFKGVFKSNSQIVSESGLSVNEVIQKADLGFAPNNEFLKALDKAKRPFIVLDTTSSDETLPWLLKSIKKGGFVVLSNKKPVTTRYSKFKELISTGENKIFFETVVGAGLPIIKTLKEMQFTGDQVMEIEGAFSGTLGFIFSELQKGRKFSAVVLDAMDRGFTEPDPRDDLSGLDVARKALILTRLLGVNMELSQVELSGMVPSNMVNLSKEDFLKNLGSLDNFYKNRISNAKKRGKTLRFVVRVNKDRTLARLQEVALDSDLGNLRGPDNMVVIKSKRYFDNPLVIKGPGAGIEVTAAGVFADILEAIKTIKQKPLQKGGAGVTRIPLV